MPAFSVWSELVALNSESVDPEWEGCAQLLHQNSVRWGQPPRRLDGITRQSRIDGSDYERRLDGITRQSRIDGSDHERRLDGITRQSRIDGSDHERRLDGITRQSRLDGSDHERRLDGITRQSRIDGSEAPPLLKVAEYQSKPSEPPSPTASPSFVGDPLKHQPITAVQRATFIKSPQLPESLQLPPPRLTSSTSTPQRELTSSISTPQRELTSSTSTPQREMAGPWTIVIHRERSHALVTGWQTSRSDLPQAPKDVLLRRHQPLPAPVRVEIPTNLPDELFSLWTHKKESQTPFDDLFDLWIA